MTKELFVIAVPKDTLADLRERLARTRWPDEIGNDNWQYGTNLAYLKELVDYWRTTYDWPQHERAINAFHHYRVTIAGQPIHFIHEPGKGPKPMPLILTHGWPWTFWDFHKVILPLSDPAAHGGDAADAFDVVVPSLPGFGFSLPLTRTGIAVREVSDRWVTLMTEVLGYPRFAAQGGDIGALVSTDLGHAYPERLIGVHLNFAVALSRDLAPASEYSDDEQGWFAKTQHFFAEERGYAAMQSTKPQTAAYGLTDSPAGLCAWIVEKRRTWSDCGGEVERRFSKDELLTTMTLYWVTGSIGSAFRSYYERAHHPWQPAHSRTPVVEAPTGVAVFPQEIIHMPRRWAERYYNLQRWTVMPKGGHFAPMEEPERLVEDIRAFFRPLRS
jgi:pimeloyl-ACP methyl ester carboxylesterase